MLKVGNMNNLHEEFESLEKFHTHLAKLLRKRQKRRKLQLALALSTENQQKSGVREKKEEIYSKQRLNTARSALAKSLKKLSKTRSNAEERKFRGFSPSINWGFSYSSIITQPMAYDHGEQQDVEKSIRNDYCHHFVDSGRRPQNFIRDTELSQRFDELRFRFLIIIKISEAKRANQNEKRTHVAATPSFIFIWSGDANGLDRGRQLLLKWGYRRCEDIVWIKTNKQWKAIFQRTKEHCIMGIKGTVRRSTDGHFIHCNVDTDVIISEEPSYEGTAKPEELYHIIEHFCLGRRRLELFGEDHNIRPGWLTLGVGLSSSNFDPVTYAKYFTEPHGYLLGSTTEIEALRPKSPPPRDNTSTPKIGPNGAKPKLKKPNPNVMPVPLPTIQNFPHRWVPMDGGLYAQNQPYEWPIISKATKTFRLASPPLLNRLNAIIIQVVEPVDYNDYMSWKRDNLRESTLNIRETLNKDLFTNSLEKNIRIHNGVSGLIECGNDSSPQYPSSFQEICAMIASGKPIPVKHIPNLINTLAPKKAQFKPRPKPWETKNESS
ncbi:hypothetical protein G9A89_019737 [Geosiphon pyriformis]|nr:hypothetical protein G9A89_019737 [Geosiphon pyriformis]